MVLQLIEQKLLRCTGRFWHLADMPTAPANVRYWSNSGQRSIVAPLLMGAPGQTSTYQTVALRLYWSVDGRV